MVERIVITIVDEVSVRHKIFVCVFIDALLTACSHTPKSIVVAPTSVRPPYPVLAVERAPGSLYQVSTFANIYQDAPLAHNIGDKVKIEIAESSSASSQSNTSSNRANKVATKGPGTNDESMNGLLKNLLNLDAEASGEDSFAGEGKAENNSTLKGKLAATVINVLPNNNLVVAGERSIAFNGVVNTLRFSGVINPRDLKPGNIVASEDVMEARLEHSGAGQLADSNSKTWLQKLLTDSLLVW